MYREALFTLFPRCLPSHLKHRMIHAIIGGVKVAVAACLVAVLYNGMFQLEYILMALVYDMLTHPTMVQPDTAHVSPSQPQCIKPNPHNVIFVRQTSKHQPENRSRRIGRLSRKFIPNIRKQSMSSSSDNDESCCQMPWFVTWRQKTSNENPLYLC